MLRCCRVRHFRERFPVSNAEDPDPLDKPRSDRTALVVDDDVFVLSALAELLSEEGFDVHTATNGFSASRVAQECHPGLILLDVKLPERSGGEILSELRSDPVTRDSAIVVVSANAHLLSEDEL